MALWEREKMLVTIISPFLTMSSVISKTYFYYLINQKHLFCHSKCFQFELSEIFSVRRGVNEPTRDIDPGQPVEFEQDGLGRKV